jgi:hypothetical protein
MRLLIGLFILSTVLTIVAVILFVRGIRQGKCGTLEGFAGGRLAAKKREIDNALLSVMGQAKKVGKFLLDRGNWSERLEMATMNPTQLARRYLNSKETRAPTLEYA